MQRALGRDSMVFGHARRVLAALWQDFAGHPEVALKRQLWDGLLREVYGTPIGDDGLFLQHTYLTIIAKTIAAAIFELPATGPEAILSGSALAEAGIHGAVESDFFDWILLDQRGRDLVARMVGEIRRFRLQSAQTDVLKALYESLIDPAQRHDLGEYYTPDWLAAKLTRAVVTAPLTQRVLDPACGSGTFLFHAVRALLGAAEAAGWGRRDALRAACAQVHGMDVHPVAVIFARVTWLLALGPALGGARDLITVPVYLGDALQWNVVDLGDAQEVRVAVPNAKPLTIPGGFAEEQARFEPALQALTDGLAHAEAPATVYRQLRHIAGVTAQDAETLRDTYAHLKSLYDDGRDGIWPYVIRNLQRPLWLSKPKQRADVVLGNPPWVAFRFMSAGMMKQVRDACKKRNLWVGGVLATQQDLSALFMARAVELYLKPGGRIGFVLPYAALNRPAYAGLRAGDFGTNGSLRITEAWSFDERVKPLFPVPASVIIGTRTDAQGLPTQVTRYAGALDKAPWNTLTPPRGPVENQFLRHVLLGESLAPFRLLRTPLAVIPADGLKVLDAKDAAAYGHIHLARWLRQTEAAWDENARKDGAGKPKMTLRQRLDHVRGLSLQLPNAGLRVVYAASGTLPSATIVENPEYLVEHKAYWTALRSRAEGQYLCAIINSEAARRRITDMQSKGQGGARDFDNLVWELRIPEYDRKIALHRALAAAAVEAESIAARVELAESAYFTTQRRAIRDALVASGVATKIDALVEQLLEG